MKKIGNPFYTNKYNRFSKTGILKTGILICLMLFLPLLSALDISAQNKGDIEVKASIGADKIGMDDVLIYTVTFKGLNNPSPPDLSKLANFNIAQSSQNREFRFVNGISSYYTNFVYYLTPTKPGTYTLPPVTYDYQGRRYKTRAFSVQVVQGSVAPQTQPQRRRRPSIFDDDDFFDSAFKRNRSGREIDIRVVPRVSARRLFKGQQIIFKVLLYTRNRIQSVNMVSNQSLPGFWQEWFPVSRSIDGESKRIDGKVYQVYEIRKAALFPTKTGTIEIPTLKFEFGLNDGFSFFSNPNRIFRSTAPVKLEVSELPPNAAGMPVGRFRLSVKAAKKQLDINDILTVKVRISGAGNLKTLTPPEFRSNDRIKVYPSKISRNVDLKSNGLLGHVEAELPVAFKGAGKIVFPPLDFDFFDPQSEKIIALSSEPFSIDVTGAKENQTRASSVPNTDIIKQGEDIDFIKKGGISNQENALYQGKVFLWLILLPILVNLLLVLKFFVFDRLIAGSDLLNRKKHLNRALKDLNHVKERGGISPILENYLKDKAGLGLSAINNQTIDQLLAAYRVSDGDIKSFIRIKSESDSARFAPVESSYTKSKLKQDIKQISEILKRIDNKIR